MLSNIHFYEEHVPANHHMQSLAKRLEQFAKVRAQGNINLYILLNRIVILYYW
jgi:hypothetical protein